MIAFLRIGLGAIHGAADGSAMRSVPPVAFSAHHRHHVSMYSINRLQPVDSCGPLLTERLQDLCSKLVDLPVPLPGSSENHSDDQMAFASFRKGPSTHFEQSWDLCGLGEETRFSLACYDEP